jgi:hypothetical protein
MEEKKNLSINFDEGIKEYEINNDPRRILRIRVTDIGLIDRAEKSINDMKSEVEKIGDIKINSDGTSADELTQSAHAVRQLNQIMRRNFDAVFYPGASNIVFGKANPLTTINGETIYEKFMRAFIETIKPVLEKEGEASNARINKYKKEYEKLHAQRLNKS